MLWDLFKEYMFILDAIWPLVQSQIPPVRDPNKAYKRKSGAGRKRTWNRTLINTIFYALMTGIQWNAITPDKEGYLCKGKTAHKWFMRWAKMAFFERLREAVLKLHKAHTGLSLKWISIDGTTYKAPLGQETIGRNPTDRGKKGTKRSLCVDENGVILVMIHAGANVHDSQLLKPTLEALKELVPEGVEIHICLDAGYVGFENLVKSYGFIPHIRPRGEEKKQKENDPNFKARRWIVEVVHAFMNQFRRMKIRYEKLDITHCALAELSAMIITLRSIFRVELGMDSFWYNKKAAKKGLPARPRPIDFTKYNTIGTDLLRDAVRCELIPSSMVTGA